MKCFYCSAELQPGTFFCPECGRRVSEIGVPSAGTGFVANPVDLAPPPTPEQADFAQDAVDETASLQLTAPATRPFVLVASTGQRFEIRGRSLLGRNPEPGPGQPYDSILVLVDPGKTVSKSHIELLVVADELLVIDLRSGNGTVVEAPGQVPVKAVPGMPLPVSRGSVLKLGKQSVVVE